MLKKFEESFLEGARSIHIAPDILEEFFEYNKMIFEAPEQRDF